MRQVRSVIISLLLSLFCISTTLAFECKVCHSKNPKMLEMHKRAEGHNCFGCHRVGERLMGKGVPKDRDAQIKRRSTEPVCLPCHTTKSVIPSG